MRDANLIEDARAYQGMNELNDNKTTTQNLWAIAKAVYRGKVITLYYIHLEARKFKTK